MATPVKLFVFLGFKLTSKPHDVVVRSQPGMYERLFISRPRDPPVLDLAIANEKPTLAD
jgi:hypothetical protein